MAELPTGPCAGMMLPSGDARVVRTFGTVSSPGQEAETELVVLKTDVVAGVRQEN